MSEAITVAVIMAIPAVLSLIVNLFNRKKLQTIHLQFNSRFDQLLASVRKESFAAGAKSEADRQIEIDGKK